MTLSDPRLETRSRDAEDKFIEACIRMRADAAGGVYIAIAKADAHLSLTLRLRRLGFTVADSVLVPPGKAYMLNGHPCPDCSDPVRDDRLRFCTPCSRRGASGTRTRG